MVHYPHSRYDVERYDKRGIVVWYELPIAGPGGYNSPGHVSNPEIHSPYRQSDRYQGIYQSGPCHPICQPQIGVVKSDSLHRAIFYHVQLQNGVNFIEIRSAKLRDSCTWVLNAKAKVDSIMTVVHLLKHIDFSLGYSKAYSNRLPLADTMDDLHYDLTGIFFTNHILFT